MCPRQCTAKLIAGGGGGTTSGNVNGDISATHPHTVSLTAAQVQQIGATQRVAVTSTTNDGHAHTVTFN